MSAARIHLGDGAYARSDGWYLWVEADRDGITHRVALEPSALIELVRAAVQADPETAGLLANAARGEGR